MIRFVLFCITAALTLLEAADARACGCFALASTASPVVQAGERILFAHEGDEVIAYIQIQYRGAADQFGWLVPLPSVPTLELGTDELFTMLDAATAPAYRITQTNLCTGGSTSGGGCLWPAARSTGTSGAPSSDLGFAASDMGAAGVVVVQASLGPYDYAVLKADDESAMLSWLDANRYFVPGGTMDAIKPYIHPGGYFLALKLRGGESAGDITPVVLRYQSDLPMIPITLTSVGAVEDMGILVWVLGEARAIPRNYYHVVLDELPVWLNAAGYNRQLIAAVHEAPGKHGFVTEYAGTSQLIANRIDYPGRFGDPNDLRARATPSAYLATLKVRGFSFDGTLLSILSRYIPEPASLAAQGVSLGLFYAMYDFYIARTPGDGGAATPFTPGPLTDEIVARVITPAAGAEALIERHPYLTRMYTALSPRDMTIDPVFSSNPDLPEVPLLHQATVSRACSGASWIDTDDSLEAQYPFANGAALPAALRVELLRDAGPPALVQDNRAAIVSALGPVSHGSSDHHGGCSVGTALARGNLALLFALAAAALLLRAWRRAKVRACRPAGYPR